MIELTTNVIAIAIQSLFVQPKPFAKDRMDELGLSALSSFRESGLLPPHITLRATHLLFGYELSFNLFGGSAVLQLTASQLNLTFQNVQNRAALSTVGNTVLRAHALI